MLVNLQLFTNSSVYVHGGNTSNVGGQRAA